MDWKSVLKGIMPIASKVIGTANPLAGFALKKASEALLGKSDGTEEEVEIALKNATPGQIAAMKKADQDFKIQLDNNKIKLEEINAKDRDSARKRQIDMKDWTPNILAIAILFVFYEVLMLLVSGEMKIAEGMKDIAIYLFGALTTIVVQVCNYFFGSSKGSKDKTNALRALKP